jgi:hypothetical protein
MGEAVVWYRLLTQNRFKDMCKIICFMNYSGQLPLVVLTYFKKKKIWKSINISTANDWNQQELYI